MSAHLTGKDNIILHGILAQLGEHLPYKQGVTGSSPVGPIFYGGIPEWPKGTDCKSAGNAFSGSNPLSPTPFIDAG